MYDLFINRTLNQNVNSVIINGRMEKFTTGHHKLTKYGVLNSAAKLLMVLWTAAIINII